MTCVNTLTAAECHDLPDRRWTDTRQGARDPPLQPAPCTTVRRQAAFDGAAKSQLTGDRVGSDPDGCGWSTRARFPRLPTSPSWRRAPHWRSSVCSSAARHPTYDEALRETNRVELVVRQIPERGRHAWGSTARNNTSCLTAEVYRGPAISRQLHAIQRGRAKSFDFRLSHHAGRVLVVNVASFPHPSTAHILTASVNHASATCS